MTDDDPTDRGSATIWVVAASALLLVIAVVLTVRSHAVVVRHRAEFAADAAALAAAGQIGVSAQPCRAAQIVATANGGTVRRCIVNLAPDGRSGQVSVTVALAVNLPIAGRNVVQASARAARDPP